MRWLLDGPLACWDVESTGVNVFEDRIVTSTVGLLQPGTPWKVDTKSWLLAVDIEIPEAATAVHGITTVQAKEHGEDPAQALDMIAYQLARAFLAHIPVVAMNCVFDFTILDRELRRHDLPTLDERLGRPIGPVVDVLVLDKYLDPFRKGGRKLTDLCLQYDVRIDGAHDSAFDALAAARVAFRIAQRSQLSVDEIASMYQSRNKPGEVAQRFRDLGQMTPADVHDAQIGWREYQCDGLRAYFDNKGIPHDGVPGHWPLIPWSSR